jgi:hypothetical protein
MWGLTFKKTAGGKGELDRLREDARRYRWIRDHGSTLLLIELTKISPAGWDARIDLNQHASCWDGVPPELKTSSRI